MRCGQRLCTRGSGGSRRPSPHSPAHARRLQRLCGPAVVRSIPTACVLPPVVVGRTLEADAPARSPTGIIARNDVMLRAVPNGSPARMGHGTSSQKQASGREGARRQQWISTGRPTSNVRSARQSSTRHHESGLHYRWQCRFQSDFSCPSSTPPSVPTPSALPTRSHPAHLLPLCRPRSQGINLQRAKWRKQTKRHLPGHQRFACTATGRSQRRSSSANCGTLHLESKIARAAV